ncbi:MAG: Crp/Fnr family transcriptional regulator [Comamonadaceae bacterium]|jgi:CRP/FNR family transcriptional regulator, dissimilatory nitrate respiration regulator
MLSAEIIDLPAEVRVLGRGVRLLTRAERSTWVTYIESGRIALGVIEGDVMEHQLGVVEGPCWLDASSAVLNLPHAVDAVSETEISLRQVPIADFHRSLVAMSESAQAVLHDVAMAHRQQTEFAVSRLAKDAEARCAEWLLRHAQTGDKGVMAVQLQQRKRSIAAQLGIAPETLSRVLRHLRERSLISGSGRLVNVDDPGGLRSLAGV